jgi:hypothetical protein
LFSSTESSESILICPLLLHAHVSAFICLHRSVYLRRHSLKPGPRLDVRFLHCLDFVFFVKKRRRTKFWQMVSWRSAST